jgi:uncharacterized protein (DUF1501 family)
MTMLRTRNGDRSDGRSIEDKARRDFTRRRFLQAALAAGSAAAVDPKFFFGADSAFAGPPLGPTDHILVLIEFDGGNDGLNTLIPYTNSSYYSLRGGLAIAANSVLPVGDGLGLNPNLPYLKARWDGGDVAIIRGVGHPDLDHSHFSCMAKIQSGTQGNAPTLTGWVGRYLDHAGLDGLGAISVADGGVPLLMRGNSAEVTGLPSWSGGLFGADRTQNSERITYESLSAISNGDGGKGYWGGQVGQNVRSALATAQLVNPIYAPAIDDDHRLQRDLILCSRIINLDLGARVLHVRLGGFDTHDEQPDDHATLLSEFNMALDAFFANLAPQFQSRVVLATFSEFGRRVRPNDSLGTDHGTASMALVIGSRVKGGFYGEQPSLTNLDSRGDLRYNVDYRSVFATLVGTWLRADDQQVFGQSFSKLDMFESGTACSPGLTDNIPAENAYNAIRPVRILDTRTGNGATKALLGPGGVIELVVAGRGTVPTTGIGAVVMNMTVADPTAASYLTVWPTGDARPEASNLNFVPGQAVPNLVLAKLGQGGKVSIYNFAGSTNVIADAMGWFPTTNSFQPLVPRRLLDTRTGVGAPVARVGANQTLKLSVLGRGGVPASGVDSVVINVTAAEPSAVSYVTVWPTGQTLPNSSNLNLTPGRVVPNLVISKLGNDGTISFYNYAGTTHLIADVVGWFPAASGFHSLTPLRILDTRVGIGVRGAVASRRSIDADGLCKGNVPSNAKAIVINVTAVEPTGGGYITVWPAGEARPDSSNLNFVPGQTVPNLVITKVGIEGMVSFYNEAGVSGATHVIADVMGWFE